MNVTTDFVDSVDDYITFVDALLKGVPERGDGGPPLNSTERKKAKTFKHDLAKVLAPNFRMAKSNAQSMYFFLRWEYRLLVTDACALYLGDAESEKLFTEEMDGITPEKFAKSAFKPTDLAWEIMKDRASDDDLVCQMLVFWTQTVQRRRAQEWTMDQARAQFMSKSKAMSWLGKLVIRGAHTTGGKTALFNTVITYGPPDHTCTARVEPFLERYGPGLHAVDCIHVPIETCHPECEKSDATTKARREKMKETSFADYGLLIAADVLREGDTVMSEFAAPPASSVVSDALEAVKRYASSTLSPEEFAELSMEASSSSDALEAIGRPKGKGRKR